MKASSPKVVAKPSDTPVRRAAKVAAKTKVRTLPENLPPPSAASKTMDPTAGGESRNATNTIASTTPETLRHPIKKPKPNHAAGAVTLCQPIRATNSNPSSAGETIDHPADAIRVAKTDPDPILLGGQQYWMALRVFSETLYDTQKIRMGISSRINRASVEQEVLQQSFEHVIESEAMLGKWLDKQIKKGPFGDFIKHSPGVGVRLLGRLLGHLGDPAVAELPDGSYRYRTVSQLRQLCGHGDATRVRRKGMSQQDAQSCGSPTMKMLVHLISESAVKEGGRSVDRWREDGVWGEGEARRPYRSTYEQRREVTANREWTDGHKHNDALRIVGKQLLKDLWVYAHSVRDAP